MNEPAFPFTPTDRSGQIAETQPGMSLRDYFAAKVIAGMMHPDHCVAARTHFPGRSDDDVELAMAKGAYAVADAMLKAREAKP